MDMPPPRIDEFRDYRDYLLEHYQWRKRLNPWYSYRILASRLGMDVSHVYRILNGRIHLATDAVPRVVKHLGLEGEAANGFASSVMEARRRDVRRH